MCYWICGVLRQKEVKRLFQVCMRRGAMTSRTNCRIAVSQGERRRQIASEASHVLISISLPLQRPYQPKTEDVAHLRLQGCSG